MLSGIMTGLLMLIFLGIVVWAYSGRRRRDFEQAARLPLDDEPPQPRQNRDERS